MPIKTAFFCIYMHIFTLKPYILSHNYLVTDYNAPLNKLYYHQYKALCFNIKSLNWHITLTNYNHTKSYAKIRRRQSICKIRNVITDIAVLWLITIQK